MTVATAGKAGALAALLALGLPAWAAGVDGVYKLSDASDCTRIGEDGGALQIARGVFYGVGSQCRMINEVPIRNMNASLFDMMCSGEGAEWVERAMVMRGADEQLILVWNGYAFAYPKCDGTPAPPISGLRPMPRPER